jgi:hypothetical protein
MRLFSITNIVEYKKVIRQIKAELIEKYSDFSKDIWFRGVSSANYDLIPKLFRDQNETGIIKNDRVVLKKFREYYNATNPETKKLTDFECLYLLQHYGAQTRLLDFTSDELVALYFATCSAQTSRLDSSMTSYYTQKFVESSGKSYEGAAVYCINPSAIISYFHSDNTKNDCNVINADNLNLDALEEEPVLCIETEFSNNRIKAQLGKFMYFGHNINLEYIFGNSDDPVAKIFIPNDYRLYIKNELREIYNITHMTIFPDNEGIIKEVNDFLFRTYR